MDHAVGGGPVVVVELDRCARLLRSRLPACAGTRCASAAADDPGDVAPLVGLTPRSAAAAAIRCRSGDPAFEPIALAQVDLAGDRRLARERRPPPDRVPLAVGEEPEPGARRLGSSSS